MREWFWRRMDSRAARDNVLGLRPRRFGPGTSGMGSLSSWGVVASVAGEETAGARGGRDCTTRSVPAKVFPVAVGRFARRGGLQLAA